MVLVRRGLNDDLEDLKLRPKLLSAFRAGMVNLVEARVDVGNRGTDYTYGMIMTSNRSLNRAYFYQYAGISISEGETVN